MKLKKKKRQERAKQAFSLSIWSFFCDVDILPIDFHSHIPSRAVSEGHLQLQEKLGNIFLVWYTTTLEK